MRDTDHHPINAKDRAGKQHQAARGKSPFEKSIVSIMKMDEATWARHANPLSVWTRFTCLPLLVVAIWSREWIGNWSLIAIGAALIWIWVNPRVFPEPADFDHWPGKATFGERVWLNRLEIPIPPHHERAVFLISLLIIPGIVLTGYGLFTLQVWPTILGSALAMMAKAWFCDRMVWLYEDMRVKNAIYASWMRRPVNDNSSRRAA